MQVPVVNCSSQVAYGEASRRTMSLADYLDHLESVSSAGLSGTSSSSPTPAHADVDRLFLKDWHLCRDDPHARFYSCPPPFRDDLLNLYFDRRFQPPPDADAVADVDVEGHPSAAVRERDDYRFVYIGPARSWCASANASALINAHTCRYSYLSLRFLANLLSIPMLQQLTSTYSSFARLSIFKDLNLHSRSLAFPFLRI